MSAYTIFIHMIYHWYGLKNKRWHYGGEIEEYCMMNNLFLTWKKNWVVLDKFKQNHHRWFILWQNNDKQWIHLSFVTEILTDMLQIIITSCFAEYHVLTIVLPIKRGCYILDAVWFHVYRIAGFFRGSKFWRSADSKVF